MIFDTEFIMYIFGLCMILISTTVVIVMPILYGIVSIISKLFKWKDIIEAVLKKWICLFGRVSCCCPLSMYVLLALLAHTDKGISIMEELSTYQLTNSLAEMVSNPLFVICNIAMTILGICAFTILHEEWDEMTKICKPENK